MPGLKLAEDCRITRLGPAEIIKAWLLDLQRPPAVNDNVRGSEIALGPDARLDASCQALGGEDTHSQGSQLRHALGSMA